MRLPRPKSAPGIFLYTLTTAAAVLLGRVLWVLVGQNVETVSAEKGYDRLLSRHWSEIMDWLAINGFWLSLLTSAFAGGALFLWGYVVLQSATEGQRTEAQAGASARADKIARINEHIAETFKTLGMALGSEIPVQYDLAIAQCEAFLIDLSRRNNIHIPEMRTDGTETGSLRVLCYLNEMLPALQLDDDVEARTRASRIVPKLNAKTADQLRADLGIPRNSPRAQNVPPAFEPVPIPAPTDEDGFNYAYRKAVIQAEVPKAKGTAEALPGSSPHKVTVVMSLRNAHRKPLRDCSVFLLSLAKEDGTSLQINEPLKVRNEGTFTLNVNANQHVRLVSRDVSDQITPEPFMMHVASREVVLAENTRYFAVIELRSRYPHPTLLKMQIDTGAGLDVHVAIIHQGLVEQMPARP